MQSYATAVPREGAFVRRHLAAQLLVSAHANAGFVPNLASTLHFQLQIPARWSLVHAHPKFDASCCRGTCRRRCLCRDSGAGRDRRALRHLDGGHSADHRPAGPRRRRLSVHRLHDLRSAGGLGNGRRRPARQAGAGACHRMEGRRRRQEEMALHAAQGREIPRRQRVQRRRRGLESRQGAERQGAAFRQAPERAGQDAAALGRELRQARRHHGRDHHQDGRLVLPLPDALVPGLQPGAIRKARQGLGQVREAAFRHRAVQADQARAARTRRTGEERRLLGQEAARQGRQDDPDPDAGGADPHQCAARRDRST